MTLWFSEKEARGRRDVLAKLRRRRDVLLRGGTQGFESHERDIMPEILIEDVGPIRSLRIPLPKLGGLVVLAGRNGRGKSIAIEAADKLVSDRGTLEPRDGMPRGNVSGCGVELTVARKTTRSGELEVTSLEGKLSPADLVDPGLKSADAADAARIKALVQLVGAPADPTLFYGLLGGKEQFEAVVSKELLATDDVVKMAGIVKREIEKESRKQEDRAEHHFGQCVALKKAANDVDVTIETDVAKLQSRLEAAVGEHSRLTSQVANAERLRQQADEAKKALAANEDAGFQDFASEIASLRDASDAAALDLRNKATAWNDAQAKANSAKQAYELAIQVDRDKSSQVLLAVERQEKQAAAIEAQRATRQTCSEIIAAAEQCVSPDITEIELAAKEVTAARQAIEQAAIARQAQQRITDANAQHELSLGHKKRAQQLRDAAAGIDNVLSDVVSQCGTSLRVVNGRLVTETRRGDTLFADLSHGERWKMAIDVAVDAFGPTNGHLPLLTIPQEAFEGLEPQAREAIAEHATARGVVILTAECTATEDIIASQWPSE